MSKNKHKILQRVLVEDYAAEGKSLARVEGKVIFIEDAVPGDVVDIRLRKSKKDWGEGSAIKFHEYSEDRVIPFCEHFGICGGCQWQMLPYEKQLQYKQKQVEDNLKRIGKISLPEIRPIIGAVTTRFYRNKIEYTFGNKRFLLPTELSDPLISAQQNVAGYHAQGIFDKVVDIRKCHLQSEPTNQLRLAVKQFAVDHGLSFYDIRNHQGFLRTMQVRICRTGEVMVNIVFGYDEQKSITQLLDHILELFPGITSLLYTINTKFNDSLYDLMPQVYHGEGAIIEQLENFKFRIGPKSFFQTNTEQGEKLYQVTREFAELTGEENVYDLYCGTGSIGIFISPKAKKIVGIETVGEAVIDAKANALLNDIHHAHFFEGDVVDVCNDTFVNEHGRPDVVITDPPRAGMQDKLVRKISELKVPKVVYVSCNPATQARDLNLLNDVYEVTAIQPVDMFPHTHHIENVVQLKLKK